METKRDLPMPQIGRLPPEEAWADVVDHPPARAFLRAYVAGRTLVRAEQISGVSRRNHYRWKDTLSGYRDAFEEAECAVRDAWDEFLAQRVETGLEERTYDAEGKLKLTRIREDSGLLRMHMQAVNPAKYGRERDESKILVVIHRDETTMM